MDHHPASLTYLARKELKELKQHMNSIDLLKPIAEGTEKGRFLPFSVPLKQCVKPLHFPESAKRTFSVSSQLPLWETFELEQIERTVGELFDAQAAVQTLMINLRRHLGIIAITIK